MNVTGKIAELQRLANKYYNCGLVIDNIFGSKTRGCLNKLPILEKGSTGDFVIWMQLRLGIVADGIFGDITLKTLREWQYNHDLMVDGECGKLTYKSLCLEV